jgi:hypothetical protein
MYQITLLANGLKLFVSLLWLIDLWVGSWEKNIWFFFSPAIIDMHNVFDYNIVICYQCLITKLLQ